MKLCACGAPVRGPRSKYCEPCRVASRNEIRKRWNAENPDKVRDSRRASKEKNREKIREYGRKYSRDYYRQHGGATKMAEWRKANPDKTREIRKRNYERYAEKRRAYAKLYRAINPEKSKASQAAWREKNLDRVREMSRIRTREWYSKNWERARAWYYENREYLIRKSVEWCQKNPDRRRLTNQRRRARLKDGCSVGVSPEAWQSICDLHGHRCAYCGALAKLEIDHVVPISRGGRDCPANVVPACKPCNSSKGNRLLSEWKGRLVASG